MPPSTSEMDNLEKNVDNLLKYMIGAEEATVQKLTQWCKQFSENVTKSKAVVSLADGRMVPEHEMRVFGEALAAKSGKFKTSKK